MKEIVIVSLALGKSVPRGDAFVISYPYGGCAPTAEHRMQQVWAKRQYDEDKRLSYAAKPGTQPRCSAERNSTPPRPGRKPPSKRPSRRGRRLSSCAHIDLRPPLPVSRRAIDSQRVTSGNRRKPP